LVWKEIDMVKRPVLRYIPDILSGSGFSLFLGCPKYRPFTAPYREAPETF
jgi:hypothetical protein